MLNTKIKQIILLRSLLFSTLLILLNSLIGLDTSMFLLIPSSIAGIFLASSCFKLNFHGRGFLILNITIIFVAYISGILLEWLSSLELINTQSIFQIYSDAQLCIITLLLSSLLSWIILRSREGLTLESIFLCVLFIQLLSSHRNFRFDLMQDVNRVAWYLNIHPLSMLIIAGVTITCFIICYIVCMGSLLAQLNGSSAYSRSSLVISILILGSIISGTAIASYNFYQVNAGTALKNGVGDDNKDGLAPLDFHQSLGASTQPAALVRLAGDYQENPLSPVLYFRESAVSKVSENKILISKSFDKDVSFTNPKEEYQSEINVGQEYRKELLQSVYLLAAHKLVFSLDYPQSIRQLKIPNTSNKFKSAYQATSIVPTFNLTSLITHEVGDSNWTTEQWNHYTELHKDKRYADLAKKIVNNIEDKVAQAQAVVEYLNESSIYTLRPNHDGDQEDDQTAKYLFGDKRGYCVHFAHATTYLLRSLGIPTRVASGYMTDLSQSKDGHLLLRMNDRHAWAEVYIRDIGWVPFDTQPANVEMHGETPVDQKTLEELMGLLGPDEGQLPEDLLKDENLDNERSFNLPSLKSVLYIILLLVAAIYSLKIYLRQAWRFNKGQKRGKLLLRAIYSYLYDLGYGRKFAETRLDHQARISKSKDIIDRATVEELLKIIYSQEVNSDLALNYFRSRSKNINLFRKILVAINPASALSFLMGGKC